MPGARMQVIATAGHVDHGKSALVRALTGMEPDRWAEEQRRGLTIDLGFAWLTLPGGQRLAFVDVPGHERFVPNMLAGLGPVPAVLFVVAADGGWMPQSAEHLAAIDAVGIRHGLLAVTRADLADPGPATRQALEHIAATSLGPVQAVAVSAVTGAGLPSLRAALARLAAFLPVPDAAAPVRLWVDRAFSIRGSGTVVTGTLPAGTIRTGQELLLTPSLRPARIRGIESLNEPAGQVSGVARVALNLRGIPAGVPARGMALVEAGRWTMSTVADVRLSAPGAAAAAPGDDAAHRLGPDPLTRVRRWDRKASAVARLTLRDPLPLHVGDHLLLRDPGSAGMTILGAAVLDVAPPALTRRGAAAAAGRELAAWPDFPAAGDLLRRHGLLPATAVAAMGLTGGLPPAVTANGWLADPARWQELRDSSPKPSPRTPGVTRCRPACSPRPPGPRCGCRTGRWSRPWPGCPRRPVPRHRSGSTAGTCAWRNQVHPGHQVSPRYPGPPSPRRWRRACGPYWRTWPGRRSWPQTPGGCANSAWTGGRSRRPRVRASCCA